MTIKLVELNIDPVRLLRQPGKKTVLLYADFNVLNFIYESKLEYGSDSIKLYPDSTAVYFACKFIYNQKIKKNISTDIQENILISTIESRANIFFFGDNDETLSRLKNNLEQKTKTISISGSHSGYDFIDEEVISKINNSGTEILFVGLGAGRQEKWIAENYNKLNCKLIVSCGGWFQYLAGYKKRAPSIMIRLHLEWLSKLLTEFSRVWYRYLIGIPKFYYRIITKKIILSFDN